MSEWSYFFWGLISQPLFHKEDSVKESRGKP